jgi:uncharacterized protein
MSEMSSTYPGSELTGAGPVKQGDRINSLDIMRGVALFGILLMNIAGMGLPEAYSNPTISGGAEGLDLLAWVTTNMFFEGTMRGMFSLLFGAGIILLTSRAEAKGHDIHIADIYYRRNILLVLFGMTHAYLLLWVGDILFYYGLASLFLFPLRKVNPRALLIMGLSINVILFVWGYGEHKTLVKQHDEYQAAMVVKASDTELDEDQEEAIETWDKMLKDSRPSEEDLQEIIDYQHGGYFGIVKNQAPIVFHIESEVAYRFLVLDALSFMLIGMALMKWGVVTLKRSRNFYWMMILFGYGIGLTINGIETRTILDGGFDMLSRSEAGLTYEFGRLATTAGHLGALAIFCSCDCLKWLKIRLAAVGRMALTNYISHSVIVIFIFTGLGFGLFGELSRYQLYYVVFGIWIFQLITSKIWLHRFRFGPLEWCWRSLTYMEPQPMKRASID